MAIEQEQSEQSGERSPRLLRGRVDSFAIYEITAEELRDLEMGSPCSLYLNFSIFCLSMAISFLTALMTTTVIGNTFIVFTVLTIVGFFSGIGLLILWWRTYTSISEVTRRIRARIPGITDVKTSNDENSN
jgi:hypothetical protein